MQRDEQKRLEDLMKESLNSKNSYKRRASSFNKLYNAYIKIDKEGKKWDEFRIKLRKKFANKLTMNQKEEYALTKNDLKRSYFEIQDNIPKSRKSRFPVELFYEISFAMIQKLSKKEDKVLDIGYGDFPSLVNLLNKKGYNAYGVEPFPKEFDKRKTFKCRIKNLPKKLKKLKFNIILANMVYCANYASHFSKNFKWELGHKKELIKKLFDLLEKDGLLILIDDIGTIFSRSDLKEYFQILLFERDIEIISFDTNKVEDFGRITLLRKN